MRILLQDSGKDLEAWLTALAKYLPHAQVRVWHEQDADLADFAIVWKPTPSLVNGRGLKAIFSRGAGVDGILQLGHDLPRDIPLVRLQDAGMGAQMVDYVLAAALRYFRGFDRYDALRQQQTWQVLAAPKRESFAIGVLGLGVLGEKIATACQQLGFPVRAWSRTPKSLAGVSCYSGLPSLPEFLQETRCLVCILPLTEETTGIINKTSLAQLPQGSFLINVARGAHVIDADLIAAIQSGQLAGATLDVFQQEPLPAEHGFWQEEKITITPHIAALTMVDESVAQIAQNLARFEQGLTMHGVVDIQRGY
jgi:glyoxylate/hydroxypyruvate reductase A